MRFPLSGKRFSLPLSGIRKFRNKIDFIFLLLALLLFLYVGTAIVMHSFQPFAPIATGSMEPVVKQGSLVIIEQVPAVKIEEGDVIVFTIPKEVRPAKYPMRLAHRVVRVENDPAAGIIFWTKGDALPAMDSFGTPAYLVQGRVARSIPILGYAWLFIQSRPGLIFLLLSTIFYLIYRLEAPVRKWFSMISTGKVTDPQLLEILKQLGQSHQEDREVIAAFTTQIAAHLDAIRGIETATRELSSVVRELKVKNSRKRKRKKRK